MGKFILVCLAVCACLWAIADHVPDSRQVAYVEPHLNVGITWVMMIGVVLGIGFWKVAKGK